MTPLKIIGVIFLLISLITALVIASYDPVEKAKAAQDEKLQQDAAAFIQAAVQYYTIKGGMPWFEEKDNGVHCFEGGSTLPSVSMATMRDCLQTLTDDSSLPTDAISPTAAKLLIVTNPSSKTKNNLDTIVCFQPQSKTWQKEPNTKYNRDGSEASPNTCNADGGNDACYWCTQ
jgi:hypothetical protein